MGWKSTHDSKVDPSGIRQKFTDINLKVHCCRYWKLREWDFENMAFPFWRLYFNTISGASVTYRETTVELDADKVVIIPPYTPFSTSLKKIENENISGNRIESVQELEQIETLGMIDHLFIHFNMGFQYDHLQPGIYQFEIDDQIRILLDTIRFSIIDQFKELKHQNTLQIYSLLILLVTQLPNHKWIEKKLDSRVMKVIEYIDNHYAEQLNNQQLSELVLMAPNSFLRLFKTSTGNTLQQYIQQKRIEKAILMMHNENPTIEVIAEKNGFCDRHNFSKVFKRIVNMSPAQYRKTQVI